MADSSPARVPPSSGRGTAVPAIVCAAALLGATAAIAAGMPQAHALSPRTALAIVGCALVWAAAQSPLTVDWARTKRVAAGVWRELGADRSPGAEDYPTRYRRAAAETGVGTRVGAWWLGLLAGVLIATAAAFFVPEGPSNWLATRTWATAALPVLWTAGAVLRLVLVARMAGAGPQSSHFIIPALFGLPAMLVLPSTALLFLTADGAVRFATAGIEAYRSRPDPGSEMRTALQDLKPHALRRRAAAVETFVAAASPPLFQRERDVVVDELAKIADRLPTRALRILAAAPQPAAAEDIAPVLRSWACATWSAGAGARAGGPRGAKDSEAEGSDGSDGFDGAWKTLRALSGSAAAAHAHLAAALAGIPRDRISVRFRRCAAIRIFGDIDADTGAHPYPGAAAWRLLETLAPDGAPAAPGDWWCALAETAADRGDTGEERTRLRWALCAGCGTAGPRLACNLARAGHRALTGGDPGTAVTFLAEAVQLEDALDYRLLLSLAQQAHGAEPDGTADPEPSADTLEPWPAGVWTTAAILRLLGGDVPASAGLLRGAESRLRESDPEAATTVHLISGVLTGDNTLVAAGARALMETHGSGWADRIPFDPATVLTRLVNDPAVLSGDSTLPAELLNGLDHAQGGELAAVRAATAHRLLAEAAQAVDDNRFGDAQDKLNGAVRLLDQAEPSAPVAAQQLVPIEADVPRAIR